MQRVSEDQQTRIAIQEGGTEREGRITGQTLDGKVYITFDEGDEEKCFDVAASRYRWL